jgi:hypothetical protein
MGETIGFETLHTAAFMVDANKQVWAYALDAPAKRGELGAALPIATEKNQTADQGVAQALTVLRSQVGACDVNDQGGVKTHG